MCKAWLENDSGHNLHYKKYKMSISTCLYLRSLIKSHAQSFHCNILCLLTYKWFAGHFCPLLQGQITFQKFWAYQSTYWQSRTVASIPPFLTTSLKNVVLSLPVCGVDLQDVQGMHTLVEPIRALSPY